VTAVWRKNGLLSDVPSLHQKPDELCRQGAAEPGANFAERRGLKQLLNAVLNELHVKPDSLSLWAGSGTRLFLLPIMEITNSNRQTDLADVAGGGALQRDGLGRDPGVEPHAKMRVDQLGESGSTRIIPTTFLLLGTIS
jgi:hypothetical protein